MSHEPLVKNETLSHGTIECSDLVATRRFLTEFLGMNIHRPVPEAQYIYKGGPWSVVCVCVEGGEAKEQLPDNRFKISVGSKEEVRHAHEEALRLSEQYGIRQVNDLVESDATLSFQLQDLNRTWWEITTADERYYERLFERGDIA